MSVHNLHLTGFLLFLLPVIVGFYPLEYLTPPYTVSSFKDRPDCDLSVELGVGDSLFICQGDTIMLMPQVSDCNNCTYLWSDGSTGSTLTTTPLASAPYAVTVQDEAGCTASDSVYVTVYDSIQVSTIITSAICDASNGIILIDITNNAGIYSILWSNGLNTYSINNVADTIAITNLLAGTYSITVTNQVCTTVISSVNIDATQQDSYTLLSETICEGSSYAVGDSVFTESGQYQLRLTNQFGCDSIIDLDLSVNAFIEVSLDTAICPEEFINIGTSVYNEAGNYIDTLTGENGCDSIIMTSLMVLNAPALPSFTLADELCLGASTTLTIANFDPALEYSWESSGDVLVEGNGGGSFSVTFDSPGTQELCMIATNRCGANSQQCATLHINTAPAASLQVTGSTIVCEGENVTYCVQNTENIDSFYWDFPTGPETTAENCFSFEWQAPPASSFSVTGLNECGFGEAISLPIEIHARPVAALLNADTILCEGSLFDLNIELTGTAPFNLAYANNMDTFYLPPMLGDTSISVVAMQDNTYSLISVSDGQCEGMVTGTMELSVYDAIEANVSAADASCNLDNGRMFITATGNSNTYTVNWTDGISSGEITSNSSQINILGLSAGTYSVTVTDQICETVESLEIFNIGDTSLTVLSQTICEGSSYSIGDSTFTESGQYEAVLLNQFGCDSTVVLHLFTDDFFVSSLDTLICDGESILIGTSVYNQAGDYLDTLTVQNGCDTIVATSLSFIPAPALPVIISVDEWCSGDTVTFNISNYDPALDYVWDFPAEATIIAENEEEAIVYFTSPGIQAYHVYAINSCGDSSQLSKNIAITTAPPPPVLASGTTEVCEGASITYCIQNTADVDSFYWELPDTTMTTTDSCQTIDWNSSLPLSFSVTGINLCGPGQQATFPVEIADGPSAFLSTPTDIFCQGDIVELALTFTGPGPYDLVYEINNEPISVLNITEDTLIPHAAIPDDTYTLVSVSNGQCTGTVDGTFQLTVYDTIATIVSVDPSSCGLPNGLIELAPQGNFDILMVYMDNSLIAELTLEDPVVEVDNLAAGDYSFLIADAFCESTVNVDMSDNCEINEIMLNATICEGDSYAFGGSSISTSGPYQDVLTNQCGCDSIINLNLEVLDATFITLDTILCNGNSLSINDTIIYSTTGNYTDTLNNSNGCDTIINTNLTILLPPPPPSLSFASHLCLGDVATINIDNYDAALTYSWDTDGVAFDDNGSNISIHFTAPGTYYFCTNAADTCGNTIEICDSIQVITTPEAPVLISGNTVVCEGSMETYCVSNTTIVDIYSWNLPTGISTTTNNCQTIEWLNNPDPFFEVTAKNVCGPGETATFTIEALPLPTANLLNEDITLCEGAPLELIVEFTGMAPYYLEYENNGNTFALSGINEDMLLLLIDTVQNGTYTLTAVTDNFCTGHAFGTVAVEVESPLSNTIDAIICAGDVYEFGGDLLTQAGEYKDTITSLLGCDSLINTLNLSLIEEVQADAGPDAQLCTDSFQMAANFPNGYLGFWAIHPFADILMPDTPDTWVYLLEPGNNVFTWTIVQAECGFISSDDVTITFEDAPFVAVNDTFFMDFDEALLIENLVLDSDTTSNFVWETELNTAPGSGFVVLDSLGNFEFSPGSAYESPIIFTYDLLNISCPEQLDTASVFIFISQDDDDGETSTGFSPNDDGVNDTFVIPGLDEYPNNKLYVYNRWDGLVYYAAPYANDWDGTNWKSGKNLPDGTYIYLLILDEASEEKRKGHVTILR
jgi:gliding motility-associated-like protein